MKLFEYAIIWHPTKKEIDEDGLKSKIIAVPTTILVADNSKAQMVTAMSIPKEYKDILDQVEIVVRPF